MSEPGSNVLSAHGRANAPVSPKTQAVACDCQSKAALKAIAALHQQHGITAADFWAGVDKALREAGLK